jgi:hypothetical protein
MLMTEGPAPFWCLALMVHLLKSTATACIMSCTQELLQPRACLADIALLLENAGVSSELLLLLFATLRRSACPLACPVLLWHASLWQQKQLFNAIMS